MPEPGELERLIEKCPTDNARGYLIYRALGYNRPQTEEIMGLGTNYHKNSFDKESDFTIADQYISEHGGGELHPEAMKLRNKWMVKIQLAMLDRIMINLSKNPELMKKSDKRWIFQAISKQNSLTGVTDKVHQEPKEEDVDDAILRKAAENGKPENKPRT